MTDMPRHWFAPHRTGRTYVDMYEGDKCCTTVFSDKSKLTAQAVAQVANEAYRRGRQDLMKELSEMIATRDDTLPRQSH